MDYVFSEIGLRRMEECARAGALCLFDFDGTLTPIVDDKDAVRLSDDVDGLLKELSRYARTGIVTGRSLADMKQRIGPEVSFLIGNHGLEGFADSEKRNAHYEHVCGKWLAEMKTALEDAVVWPGVSVENKRYSLSVHYRAAPDPAKMEVRLREWMARLDPAPRVMGGKSVLNILPVDAPDKGKALLRLLRDTGAAGAIYAGDDVTDEDVFSLARGDIFSIRIGQSATSAARFYLHDCGEITRLLVMLIDLFKRPIS